MLVVGILDRGRHLRPRLRRRCRTQEVGTARSRARRKRWTPANETAADFERRQQAAEDFVESAYPALAGEAARRQEHRDPRARPGRPDGGAGSSGRSRTTARVGSRGCARSSCRCGWKRSRPRSARKPELGGYVGDAQLGNLGRDLGRELAAGGATPLWDALESEIVEVRDGRLADPVDGVIVMRTAEPQAGRDVPVPRRYLPGPRQRRGARRRRRADPRRAERDPCLPALPALDGGRRRHAGRRARDAARPGPSRCRR